MMVVSVIAVVGFAPTGSAAADPVSDLVVTNAGPETTTQDADVAYAVAVRNLGPDAADAVTMTFTPAGNAPADATFCLAPVRGPGHVMRDPRRRELGAVTCTSGESRPRCRARR